MSIIATARHILVRSESECNFLKKKLENGADFAETAASFSACSSAKEGGDLGSFSPCQMEKEIDRVAFNCEIGPIHGPIKTQFGYHLLQIQSRSA
ncbi:MAG: peptidylprolyl isomerase [Pseudomonadota bacterium]